MHVAQPEEAIAAIRGAIERIDRPFALAALHVMTTLSGSVLIALAHAVGRARRRCRPGPRPMWTSCFQESVWGEDHEAMERRRSREADFRAASEVFRLDAE